MDTETPERPNIQIDDLVRPMTDEEYVAWLEQQANPPAPLGVE
jgi:hypothetical protein